MAQALAPARAETSIAATSHSPVLAIAVFLFISFLVFAGIKALAPPAAAPASVPIEEFSAARARSRLEAIAQVPHPIGSPAHDKVRDYILEALTEIGLTPEVQRATVVNSRRDTPFPAASVQNIIARFKGTENGGAVMLAAHYDSVPSAPGAGDDGAAVAGMLETAQALTAAGPLRNDVIFLFTDGEEVGLLGAKAFVEGHPWARDVRVVLNFDARGSGGPTVMFETSNGNGWLISRLGKSSTHAVANSLMQEIYKFLPNYTDFTVFKEEGMAGLNFAFIDGSVSYHTQLDNLENVNDRSIQHQGMQALGLTRHLGNLPLDAARGSNAIYFDLFGATLIHYPAKWAIPLAAAVSVLFIALLVIGFKRRRIQPVKVLLGFSAFLLFAISIVAAAWLIWLVVRSLYSGYRPLPSANTYNSNLYMISFIALAVALLSIQLPWLSKRIGLLNLTASTLFCWLILMLFSALYLPGASYLFTWPLLFALLGFGYGLLSRNQTAGTIKQAAIESVAIVPALVLMVPVIYLLFTATGLSQLAPLMALLALLLGLLIPQFNLMTATNRRLLPATALLVSLGFLVAGSLAAKPNASHPTPSNIFYGLNADTQNATWASTNRGPDEWTSQFFSNGPSSDNLSEYLPGNPRMLITGKAPVAALAAPAVLLLADDTSNDTRTLRLRITSSRKAPVLSLYLSAGTHVTGASINGKEIPSGSTNSRSPWALRYYAPPPEGIDITLKVNSSGALKLTVVDQSYGLPEIENFFYKPKPPYVMSASLNSDSTLVSKSYNF